MALANWHMSKGEIQEISMITNIAPRVTAKCFGSVMAKRRKKMGIADQTFVESIVSEVKAAIFEGGAGSGNWGHKGRPGMRGGSLGGGGGGKGVSPHVVAVNGKKAWGGGMHKVGTKVSHASNLKLSGGVVIGTQAGIGKIPSRNKVKWPDGSTTFATPNALIPTGGRGGISAHKITVGGEKSHARDYYNAAGKLDAANYSKLSGANKAQVLKHGIQKYTESYVPKAQQGKLDANGLSANKKIGALEGMRRSAVNNAKNSTGKESRAAMHVAISLQVKAIEVVGQLKASGSRAAGAATGLGSKVVGAGLTAVRIAERPVGR